MTKQTSVNNVPRSQAPAFCGPSHRQKITFRFRIRRMDSLKVGLNSLHFFGYTPSDQALTPTFGGHSTTLSKITARPTAQGGGLGYNRRTIATRKQDLHVRDFPKFLHRCPHRNFIWYRDLSGALIPVGAGCLPARGSERIGQRGALDGSQRFHTAKQRHRRD